MGGGDAEKIWQKENMLLSMKKKQKYVFNIFILYLQILYDNNYWSIIDIYFDDTISTPNSENKCPYFDLKAPIWC